MRLMQYGNMAYGTAEDWRPGEYAGVIRGHMAGMILCHDEEGKAIFDGDENGKVNDGDRAFEAFMIGKMDKKV